ncbi:MAG: transcription termination factor NusA [Candidatus Neomarinimicrobiota bacterium]
MINRDLIEIFIELAREKNIERSELGTIIEQLFLFIIEKETGESDNCSVIVNLDKGEIEIYVEKTIVEEVDDDHFDITLERAIELEPDLAGELKLGDTFVEVIDPARFGRRLVANARQFLNKRTREVQQQYIYEDYVQRIGEVIIGTVHQVHRENTFVNIEQTELRMPRNEQIYSERFRRGDTIRALVKSVEVTSKGPDILISRSDDLFLYKLFEMEVPEIEDGIIEIKGIARKPGERSKIIVHSVDKRIDAVGACVGMRGSRIQSVVRELNNEKIDIVNYTEKSEVFITRALSPAKPIDLYIDDDRKYCVAIFDEGGLENAVGRSGVNINLASKLTGYTIDAYTKSEYDEVLVNQKTTLESLKGITKTLNNKLAKVGIISVANYLNTKKYVLTDELELNEKEVRSISDAVNLFIEVTHNKNDKTDEEIKITEEKNDSDVNQVVEEVVENLPDEESKDDSEENVADSEIEPKNVEEKEEE